MQILMTTVARGNISLEEVTAIVSLENLLHDELDRFVKMLEQQHMEEDIADTSDDDTHTELDASAIRQVWADVRTNTLSWLGFPLRGEKPITNMHPRTHPAPGRETISFSRIVPDYGWESVLTQNRKKSGLVLKYGTSAIHPTSEQETCLWFSARPLINYFSTQHFQQNKGFSARPCLRCSCKKLAATFMARARSCQGHSNFATSSKILHFSCS